MPHGENVLLLNPPGNRIYIRDYYCSKVSKAHYTYQPVDLVILSGILGARGPVEVLDAIIEGMSPHRCIERILSRDYTAIVFLAGAASRESDFAFMRDVRERSRAVLIGSGDVFMEESAKTLHEQPWLDAVCLDFTSPDILSYLDNRDGTTHYPAIAYRNSHGVISSQVRPARGEFEIPVPRHELFPNGRYTYPFVRRSPFVTVLTDYGCPYSCMFCIMSRLGYKHRSIRNVMEELAYVNKLGIKEIYFADQTFGAVTERAHELCREMIARRYGFGWVCFSRVDIIDGETLRIMKRAGCHTIIFGVESGSEHIIRESAKGTTLDMAREAFRLCRKEGIATVGTFIIGLPGDTADSIRQTINFAKELKCDYASFNVPVPRMLTPLRRWAIREKMIVPGVQEMDQSGTYAVMATTHLSREKIMELKREAIFKFYLRPGYLLQRLFSLFSFWDLKRHVLGLLSLIRNAFSRT
jgi:radical SAM superfamily enzyme YgiQ (UPF0313 family)